MQERTPGNPRRLARAGWFLALAFPLISGTAAACAGARVPRGKTNVRSLQEIRQERVVRQKWDLSCGSAALSTLLTYDVGDPIGEGEIIASILQRADPVKIRARQGFSLLDLKRFVVARGHEADGYGRLDLAHLARMAPAIVPTVMAGLDHFVVVRGIREGHVLLADPGFGNRTLTVEKFEAIWPRRIAFVVRPKGDERESAAQTPLSDSDLSIVRPPMVREAVGALR